MGSKLRIVTQRIFQLDDNKRGISFVLERRQIGD